ncbi:hypothetical protein M3Y97_00537300 [Aphelenchoides bicaudatus]|nr:hypothetical protein M3Y97_00537300 [Aphelenchoides bicaudatus]
MSLLTSLLTTPVTFQTPKIETTDTVPMVETPKVIVATTPNGNSLICSVCGDVADGAHFGSADSCRACAAFFRRTISKKLKYICRFDGDCDISKNYRSLCRACRLRKCEEMGMKASAVRSECVDVVRPPKAVRKSSPPVNAHLMAYDNPIPVPTTTPISIHQLHISPPMSTTTAPLNVPVTGSSIWSHSQRSCDSVSSGGLFLEADSPYATSSSASTTSPANHHNITAQQHKSSFLHDIVEINTEEYFVDVTSLPQTHPLLTKMLIAYEGIQRRRDIRFDRSRDCEGVTTRIYTRKEIFDCHRFFEMTQVEIELIAGMLQSFEGYRELPHEDKVEIFKSYWIHFVILERNFDTYRVLGNEVDDRRIVFANGDIIDVLNCQYDLTQVTDAPMDAVRRSVHPWYRMSALELIVQVKKLQPTDVEMMFCLGLMLWHFGVDLAAKLSPATLKFAEKMVDALYNELSAYYTQVVQLGNNVKRVAELMRLLSTVQRIIIHRNEDRILARTFKTFKVDIYFEGLLNE